MAGRICENKRKKEKKIQPKRIAIRLGEAIVDKNLIVNFKTAI
jgi:hypothetical protein